MGGAVLAALVLLATLIAWLFLRGDDPGDEAATGAGAPPPASAAAPE